jgi:hypothetical protein
MTQGSDYITAQLLSIGVLVGSFLSYIPQTLAVTATFLVIIHYVILIRESRSWAAWLDRHKLSQAAEVAKGEIKTAAVAAKVEVRQEAAIAAEVVREQAAAITETLKSTLPTGGTP